MNHNSIHSSNLFFINFFLLLVSENGQYSDFLTNSEFYDPYLLKWTSRVALENLCVGDFFHLTRSGFFGL